MYFVLIMKKVQTGQVIEFYSNSCLVKTESGKLNCLAIKNIVVGDYVEVEIIQDSKKHLGNIIKVKNRSSVLSKKMVTKISYLQLISHMLGYWLRRSQKRRQSLLINGF